MAQVCQARDDSRLYGRGMLAQGTWFQDIRGGYRRPARPCRRPESLSSPALPVPPDDDGKALSHQESRHRGFAGAPLPRRQHAPDGQGEFHGGLRGMARQI